MSDPNKPGAAPEAGAPALAPAAPSAGALLRAARERAGLPVDEFAALLKVTTRRVELLETDQFDQLPDPVFVRALAQSMCRSLKIDPTPVLALLPRTPAHRLDAVHVGLNAPFREGPTQILPDDWMGRVLPFLGGASLLVAGGLLFYFLPSSWNAPAKVQPRVVTAAPSAPASTPQPAAPQSTAPQPTTESVVPRVPSAAAPSAAAQPEHAAPAPLEVARATPNPAPPPQPTPTPTPTLQPAPAAPAQPAAPAPAQPASLTVPAGTTAAKPPAGAPAASVAAAPVSKTPPAAPSGLLQLRSSEAAWVQVHDGQGAVLLARELRAGEAVGLNGATPLKVTIGNVRATQIAFRGKAMDLRSFTRDNVARIELQ